MAPSGRSLGMEFPYARGGKNVVGGGGGKFQKRMVMTDEKPIHVRFSKPEKGRVDMVPRDIVERCIIALFEKRGSTREAAMEDLVGALEGYVAAREVSYKYTTIVSRCVFSLKKGSVREALLAYRAIGILALTLGGGGGGDATPSSKDILAEAFPFLAKTVEASRDMAKVLAAVDSLAVATFAGADGDDEIERSMDVIWGGVIDPSSGPGGSKLAGDARKTTPEVLAAAVSAWAFLLTAVHERYEADEGESCKDNIALLAKLLDDKDDRVRIAAGEAIASCVELKLAHDTSPEDMEALNATISYLATEPAGKGAAADKRRRAGQKDIFRQIEVFLDDGEPPTKSVRTSSSKQSVIKVTTWTKLLQLNFLTRYLGNGFHSHLQHNPLFDETFKIAVDEVEGLPAAKKKLSRKQRKKKRTLERRRCRDAVWKEKNKFGLPEEEPESDTTALMLLPAPASYHHMLPPVHRQPHLLPPTPASHMLPPVQQPILLLEY